jgi:hypothetical protein
MLMLMCVLVYIRVVGQYIHNEPTLNDRFFNRKYFAEWSAKQAKKKAKEDQKAKEEKEAKAAADLKVAAYDVEAPSAHPAGKPSFLARFGF